LAEVVLDNAFFSLEMELELAAIRGILEVAVVFEEVGVEGLLGGFEILFGDAEWLVLVVLG